MRIILRIIFVLALTTDAFSQQMQLVDSTLIFEYRIYSTDDSLQITKLLIDKAYYCFRKKKFWECTNAIDRVYKQNIKNLELIHRFNTLKALMFVEKRDFRLAYYQLKSMPVYSIEDSTLVDVALIENLKIEEWIDFRKNQFSSEKIEMIRMEFVKFQRQIDEDCQKYYLRSLKLPSFGLYSQKAFKKGLVNSTLIYSFLGYGIYHFIKHFYFTAFLTGAKGALQFYLAGARLSYSNCEKRKSQFTDSFKLKMYNVF